MALLTKKTTSQFSLPSMLRFTLRHTWTDEIKYDDHSIDGPTLAISLFCSCSLSHGDRWRARCIALDICYLLEPASERAKKSSKRCKRKANKRVWKLFSALFSSPCTTNSNLGKQRVILNEPTLFLSEPLIVCIN